MPKRQTRAIEKFLSSVPTPSSDEAIRQGCLCPVIDNHYGKGFGVSKNETSYYISERCPLHGVSHE
jgi:hypothetical protein